MTDLAVIFDELPTRDGGRIGVATLNAPKSLNALSLEMAQQLLAKLDAWAVDRSVVAVWLEGAGDKAFCAGGDIVALYRSMTEEGENRGAGRDSVFAETYFTAEYRLDYRIHTYPKPLLLWGDGIVMGGGLGLMAGASQRLVTETTRIAMPEITIGLYPDIGASWFLNRMPTGVGAYLGLTGAQLNARDALDLGMADHFVPRECREALLEALAEADYGTRSLRDLRAGVQTALDEMEDRAQAPEPQVWPRLDHIQALVGQVDAASAVQRILHDAPEDAWLAANRARLEAGSPMSAHLVWRMLERHAHTSLADAFRDELNLSVQCCRQGDIAEGVRALLIDKDKMPRWQHADAASVPEADIQALMTPMWSDEAHPLRDLGYGQRVS
ncbi:enoyl-CoA hydratase/isomerase family protein [Halomonas campisalis]|uniref:3-hydroxyisobutyryl-CoA hydrolase n=1 Tax=Billgrantia campisalis TaxID=74661 RepID=A0ABS9P5R0_9GAMM|nr:enoyl-CoA hydratase/isomerase family protein [Halomonas campisalis]MCG6656936.1 enoyl-CoA hydratase/isomerase family protein [Halomonas campisalis]MDR5862124.1 enoyl-CoA hydratase/isomerase family protein [Halomonas campisalis]